MDQPVNSDTTDTVDLPMAADPAPQRRAWLSRTDQRCIASLATLAIVAVGISSFGLVSEHSALVDLPYPVVVKSDQQAAVDDKSTEAPHVHSQRTWLLSMRWS